MKNQHHAGFNRRLTGVIFFSLFITYGALTGDWREAAVLSACFWTGYVTGILQMLSDNS